MGDVLANQNLSRAGLVFEPDGLADRRTGDDELRMPVPGQEQVDVAAGHAHRHTQAHAPDAALQGIALREGGAHGERRRGGLPGVVVAANEQGDGVAAELEHLAAVLACAGEEGGEGVGDQPGDLLGAGLPAAREPLREAREAGDVAEGEGPPHTVMTGARTVGVLCQQGGDVGAQRGSGGVHRNGSVVPSRPRARAGCAG